PPPFPPFFSPSPAPPDLPSFPTRRSSDLDLGAILREAFLHRFQRHRLAVISVLIPADTRVVIHADDVEGAIRERFGRRYPDPAEDRKSTRLNSSHVSISYAVFCLKKKKNN